MRHLLLILLTAGTCSALALAGEAEPPGTGGLTLVYSFSESTLARVKAKEPRPEGVTDGILELQGLVDRTMLALFNEAVSKGNVSRVRISSRGGDAVVGLQIAATMVARNIEVIVHGLCAGTCAQHIFMAGSRRRIEKGALIGFVASIKGSAAQLRIATETLEVANPLAAVMARYAAAEADLYLRRGVSESVLLDMEVGLQPTCIIVRRSGSNISWRTQSNYQMWVPTRQYLQAAGVEFDGDWPSSRKEMSRVADSLFKRRVAQHVRFGDEDHRRGRKQKPYALEHLRECVLDEEVAPAAD
jgi:hypothetical protein